MGLGWFGVGFVDGSGAGERREEEGHGLRACLIGKGLHFGDGSAR